MRILLIIAAVILGLIGLTFVADRGGHESYNAQLFKPGPVIGLIKGLEETDSKARAQEMFAARMSALDMLKVGNTYEHAYDGGTNLVAAIQGVEMSTDGSILIVARYDGGVQADQATAAATLLAIAERYSRKRVASTHSLVFLLTDSDDGLNAFLNDPSIPAELLVYHIELGPMARVSGETLLADGTAPTDMLKSLLEQAVGESGFPVAIETAKAETAPFSLSIRKTDIVASAGDPSIDQDILLQSVDNTLMLIAKIDEQLEPIIGLPPLASEQQE